MRLGFYYHTPAVIKGGKILLPGYLGRFLDELARHCQHLVLFLHLPNADDAITFDYALNAGNVRLVSLPPRGSVPHRVLFSGGYTRRIRAHSGALDALLLRGPSPLIPAIARACHPVRTIFLLIGDYVAGVDSMTQPGWRVALVRFWSTLNARQQLRAAQNSLVFVNSRLLYQQFEGKVGRLEETRTTTLTKADFYQRADTCLAQPVNLLYTGRIEPAKGLLDIVAAVSLLVQRGENVVLNLVGWAEDGSNILELIRSQAEGSKISDRVIFHGYKAVGPELFDYYKKSDIYVTASQDSEGFPRTIWEAMAHCLPVVATRVGSIPDFVSGAAELTEPKNPPALADAIAEMIHNGEKRRQYIGRGFAMAQQNSLEIQVAKMIRMMEKS